METGRRWRTHQGIRHERQDEEEAEAQTRSDPRQGSLICVGVARQQETAVSRGETQGFSSRKLDKRETPCTGRRELHDPLDAGQPVNRLPGVVSMSTRRGPPWKKRRSRLSSYGCLVFIAVGLGLSTCRAAEGTEGQHGSTVADVLSSEDSHSHFTVPASLLPSSSSSSPTSSQDLPVLSIPQHVIAPVASQRNSPTDPFTSSAASTSPSWSESPAGRVPRSSSVSSSLSTGSRSSPFSSRSPWRSLISSYSIPVQMVGARAAIRNMSVGKQNLLLALDSQTEGIRVFLTNSTACTYSSDGQAKHSFPHSRKLDGSFSFPDSEEKPSRSAHINHSQNDLSPRKLSGSVNDDDSATTFEEGGETDRHYQKYLLSSVSLREGEIKGGNKDKEKKDSTAKDDIPQTDKQDNVSLPSSSSPSSPLSSSSKLEKHGLKRKTDTNVWGQEGGGNCYDPKESGEATWCLNWGKPCSFLSADPFQCKGDTHFELSQAAKYSQRSDGIRISEMRLEGHDLVRLDLGKVPGPHLLPSRAFSSEDGKKQGKEDAFLPLNTFLPPIFGEDRLMPIKGVGARTSDVYDAYTGVQGVWGIAGPELCCRNESLWSSTLKALNVTSYSFDLNFPPSSSWVSSFSSSPLSLPPSFLHLGVLDDDDRRIQEREQAESEKDRNDGRHKEEGEEKKNKKKQGVKSLSGEIRGFTFYDAVGPIGTSGGNKGEEHRGYKLHHKKREKEGERGERHDKQEDEDDPDGKTKGDKESDFRKKREDRVEKRGERIPRSTKSEKVYWSERIQTGSVWGDGVAHFSSYDWSICGQNLMGASHMYDWLVTLDLSSECLVVPRPLWSSIRSWLEPGLNITSPFCTLSDVLVPPPPRRLSSHPAPSASASSTSPSSSSLASTSSSSSNQEEKPGMREDNSTLSESEKEGKGGQEKSGKKGVDVPRRLTCPLRMHFLGGLRSRRRLLSTDIKATDAMEEPLDSLASYRVQQVQSSLPSDISFSSFSTEEPSLGLSHEGDVSFSSFSSRTRPTASTHLTAEGNVSSSSVSSDSPFSSSSFDVSSGSSPRSLSSSSSSFSSPLPSGGLSLLGLVEKMASSLFGLHTRPSLPVLSFTLRSSLESQPADILQAVGTKKTGGERRSEHESDASTMGNRLQGEKENLYLDELRIELPLEQLVINDPQTGGREALCVVPQPYSLLTREGRTIRMGTRALAAFQVIVDQKRWRVGLLPKDLHLPSSNDSCAVERTCKGQQTYMAPSNECVDPICSDRLLFSLDAQTKTCQLSPWVVPALGTFVGLLVGLEVLVVALHWRNIVRARMLS
ncbi:serine threonine protein related protein [Cystoisospora suis]|uniref:Serine threonine protein related protein n=1 Tax=Cystoisospora suis TaxID=483139 RepID=A0A2C6LHX9_9APIC|nr:serine threonine protein related protein [Cystoisospora suis]